MKKLIASLLFVLCSCASSNEQMETVCKLDSTFTPIETLENGGYDALILGEGNRLCKVACTLGGACSIKWIKTLTSTPTTQK